MALEAAFVVPHPPLIIPTVGRGEEARIQATIDAYEDVARQIARIEPQTIVVTSPHATAYADYFHISPGTGAAGDMLRFAAPNSQLSCTYDVELAHRIASLADEAGLPAGTQGERDPDLDHATYIPLFFVNEFYRDYEVVRIGLSGLGPLEHYRLGELVNQAIGDTGRRAVLVASGDLSHKLLDDGPYGFAPEGPVFDEKVTDALAKGDFARLLTIDESLCDKAAECGLRSFQIMAGALDGKDVTARLLSYEGPFGVGYAVASFYVEGPDETRHFADRIRATERERIDARRGDEDAYVRLARSTIERFVRTGTPPDSLPQDLPAQMLDTRAGTFVSLHEHGRLRGCIGTIGPVTANVAQEIVHNAIAACSEDPRFEPVDTDELDMLEISVDVLGEPEDIDSASQLDPRRYGVIVTNGARRGLLLPMLDGVDTIEQQVAIAKRKAGIGEHEAGTTLQRFEVVRHEPEARS